MVNAVRNSLCRVLSVAQLINFQVKFENAYSSHLQFVQRLKYVQAASHLFHREAPASFFNPRTFHQVK